MAILSFKDRLTEDFFCKGTLPSKGVKWHSLEKIVLRKLDIIKAATDLKDLRVIRGNHLEKLQNSSLHSIRVNNQWRIIFKWTVEGAEDVEIIDYH